MSVSTRTDPRAVVASAPIELLAEASAEGAVFGFIDADRNDPARFTCPTCAWESFSGGSAIIRDAWRFDCHRCGAAGTRWALERLVLEDHRRLEHLYTLLPCR